VAVYEGWADKMCIRNFGGEAFGKKSTWKTKMEIRVGITLCLFLRKNTVRIKEG
jgi:hypothetical protein